METSDRLEPGRDSGHQQPHRAGGSEPNRARSENGRADGGGRHDRGSGDRVHRSRRDDRRRHDPAPGRLARRPDDDRRRLRDLTAARASSTRGSATACTILNHCVITDSHDRRRRARRPVRAPAERRGRPRARTGRQLRRAEEDGARRRIEGDAPRVSRRRDDRRRRCNIGAGTITCNYDGVTKTHDGHRGRRVHRQRLAARSRRSRSARARYVGSGTTIREDVPPGALAVSAGKQRNIDGWVEHARRRSGR